MAGSLRGFLTVSLTTWAVMLGAPSAEAVSDTCVYDDATKTVQIRFPDGPGQARTVSRETGGNHIIYNGTPCADATVRNTDSIMVSATDGAQELTVDLSNGPFAPGASPEPSGIDEIELFVDLGNGTDSLIVVGSSDKDRVVIEGPLHIDLDIDQDADLMPIGVDRWAFLLGDARDVLWAGRGVSLPLVISGGGGRDWIEGSGGGDTIDGGAGDDKIQGSLGMDVLIGGGGEDALDGDEDDDTVSGGQGKDLIGGGPGDDSLVAEPVPDGADHFIGGLGVDGVSYRDRVQRVRLDPFGGSDDGELQEDDRIDDDVENLEGGAGNDRITGDNDTDNILIGNGGDDELDGNNGDDWLYGNSGNDIVEGVTGDDALVGGDGDDHVWGSYGNDTMFADAGADGDDDYRGGLGIDTLTYAARSSGVEVAIGTKGNGAPGEQDHVQEFIEIVEGGEGPDTIGGTETAETLIGNGGADVLGGAAGADLLEGGDGADTIRAGDGADEVFGDEGDDTLHLSDGGVDIADCGGGTDDASDRDSFDVALTACEVT